jgi:hypothetical protein
MMIGAPIAALLAGLAGAIIGAIFDSALSAVSTHRPNDNETDNC